MAAVANINAIVDQGDYRAILRSELERRQTKNLNYSQRAFARDLKIGPNRLSEILNGKQGLSPAYAKQIAGQLGLNAVESQYFCEIVREKHARSKRERELAQSRMEELRKELAYHPLSLEAFHLISDWPHLAVIELSKTKGFKLESGWIAKRLSLPQSEIKEVLHRLEKVGLLQKKEGGFKFVENNSIAKGIPSDFIKQFHEGVLKRAGEAIWKQKMEERDYSSTLIAIDKKAVAEIKKRISKFWQQIDRDFGCKGDPANVYALGIQFFSLTELENE